MLVDGGPRRDLDQQWRGCVTDLTGISWWSGPALAKSPGAYLEEKRRDRGLWRRWPSKRFSKREKGGREAVENRQKKINVEEDRSRWEMKKLGRTGAVAGPGKPLPFQENSEQKILAQPTVSWEAQENKAKKQIKKHNKVEGCGEDKRVLPLSPCVVGQGRGWLRRACRCPSAPAVCLSGLTCLKATSHQVVQKHPASQSGQRESHHHQPLLLPPPPHHHWMRRAEAGAPSMARFTTDIHAPGSKPEPTVWDMLGARQCWSTI